MKGQATITVKDKNGNIKTSVKQHNKIFNMPQILLQDLADNGDIYFGNLNNEDVDFIDVIPLKDYFRSIYVHSEDLSLETPYDFKFPELIGGYIAGADIADYANIGVDNTTENKITLVWAWTPDKQKTLKSIALRPYFTSYMQDAGLYKKLSNDYFLKGNLLYKRRLDVSNNGFSFKMVDSNVYALHADNTKVIKCSGYTLYIYDLLTNSNIKTIGRIPVQANRISTFIKPDGTYEGFVTRTGHTDYVHYFTFDENGDNLTVTSSLPNGVPSTMSELCTVGEKFAIFQFGGNYYIYDYSTQKYIINKTPCVSYGYADTNIKHALSESSNTNVHIRPVPYFNTTALNLSAPVTVEAGETITITYEITATE